MATTYEDREPEPQTDIDVDNAENIEKEITTDDPSHQNNNAEETSVQEETVKSSTKLPAPKKVVKTEIIMPHNDTQNDPVREYEVMLKVNKKFLRSWMCVSYMFSLLCVTLCKAVNVVGPWNDWWASYMGTVAAYSAFFYIIVVFVMTLFQVMPNVKLNFGVVMTVFTAVCAALFLAVALAGMTYMFNNSDYMNSYVYSVYDKSGRNIMEDKLLKANSSTDDGKKLLTEKQVYTILHAKSFVRFVVVIAMIVHSLSFAGMFSILIQYCIKWRRHGKDFHHEEIYM